MVSEVLSIQDVMIRQAAQSAVVNRYGQAPFYLWTGGDHWRLARELKLNGVGDGERLQPAEAIRRFGVGRIFRLEGAIAGECGLEIAPGKGGDVRLKALPVGWGVDFSKVDGPISIKATDAGCQAW